MVEFFDVALVVAIIIVLLKEQLKNLYYHILDNYIGSSGKTVVFLQELKNPVCLGKKLKDKLLSKKNQHFRYT